MSEYLQVLNCNLTSRSINRMNTRTFTTGVSLRHEIRQYLDDLAQKEGRTRSNLINAIVRQHQRRHDPEFQPSDEVQNTSNARSAGKNP